MREVSYIYGTEKHIVWVINDVLLNVFSAGRATTNDELENMLESGNPAIFTQGVSRNFIALFLSWMMMIGLKDVLFTKWRVLNFQVDLRSLVM